MILEISDPRLAIEIERIQVFFQQNLQLYLKNGLIHIILQNPQDPHYRFHLIKKGLIDYCISDDAAESVTKNEYHSINLKIFNLEYGK